MRGEDPGGRTFVAVDGGLSDNPRVSLYGARYTGALATRRSMEAKRPVTVAGRHFESGDEIARDVLLPADVRSGDLTGVACTGAYRHSMTSKVGGLCRFGQPALGKTAGGSVGEGMGCCSRHVRQV